MNTTILIVEDDDILRPALGRWARKHDLVPLESASAEEALDLLQTHDADLALVDLRLPGLDGLVLAEKLIKRDADRPVVIMTAHTDLDDVRQAFSIGVYEYITKPFELDDLYLCVQRALEHRSLRLENRAYREHLEEEVARRTQELEHEIEERKKVEQALRLNEAQLKLITDSLPGHVSYVDTDECYQFVNEKYESTFGIAREEVFGKHMSYVLGEQVYKRHKPYIERALLGEKVEFEAPFPNDLDRTVFITYVPHIDADEVVVGFFVLAVDVTERRQMEVRVVQLERLGALAEMSEGVSHNLNNILTGILGPAQLIELYTQDKNVLQETKIIQNATMRAADLVKRISFSVGNDAESPLPVGVCRAMQEAINAAQPRWKDEAEKNGKTYDIVMELPSLPTVHAAPKELQNVFLNLILNALDAMPNGGKLSIFAGVVDQEVQITVVDTGIGMDEEIRRRVFEPFFTTKADVGTGLGLSSVFTSVTRWGGGIDIQSSPGEGTTVLLTLPIWKKEDMTGVLETQRSGSILIVEDEDIVRNFLVRVLERHHDVDVVENGHDALEMFTPDKYDVAMVDLGMPEMPGDRLVEKLTNCDPQIVTVLITGWDLDAHDPRRSVFDFHLKKPFDSVEKIMNILAHAIHTRDVRAEGQI